MKIKNKFLREYIKDIKNGVIPKVAPPPIREVGFDELSARSTICDTGLWVKISQKYFTDLLPFIADNKVLEVMAGAGWFGKGLSELGVTIHCTDDFSWQEDGAHNNLNMVHPIEKLEATVAVEKYKDQFDMLLISWPPYGDETILKICKEWGSAKPILYIGEEGGCNAPETFFEKFQCRDILYTEQWVGIHDNVLIGYYID